MRNILVLFGLMAALTACAATSSTERKVTFLCDRGQTVNVTFADGIAHLAGEGMSADLTQQRVASGIHYTGGGHDLRGKGPELTWTDPTGTVRQCRDQEWAMRQPQIAEPIPTLAGTSWQLVHFQSSDDAIGTVVPPAVERYRLRFTADGTLALQLDCNRASARWEAVPSGSRGGTLSLTAGPMTRAMCQPGAMDMRIAQDTVHIRSYTLVGDRLNLALEADAGIYVWQRVQGDE